MKTRFMSAGNFLISLAICLGVSSCNKDDFYQKQFLENPYQDPTANGSVQGGVQGGIDAGAAGGTQGGVNGGTVGDTTGGSTSGSTTGGAQGGVNGGTTGGSTGGTSTGSADNGSVTHEAVTETFHQSAEQTKKLDIMWVIDNSGSMADEQDALAHNFDVFIHDFITRNVDFKMSITTTDTTSGHKGVMVPGSDQKLNSQAAQANPNQFIADFKSMVKVGIRGSGNEKGLEGSEGFMMNYGSTFIRQDAYLAVVIVSDEEDQSPKTPTQYTDYLKSFKSEAGLVKVYSIVDKNLQTTGAGTTLGYQRYATASSNTAGTVADIHGDFYSALEDMGAAIMNLLDSFALANEPVAGSLQVYVNGALTTDYTYDSASRSIKFAQGHLPPVGAEVKVTYLKN